MKVLHLFSDWKWTGPAEPVVSLCEVLARAGIDVTVGYRKTPIDFPERTVEKEVKGRGLSFFEGFKLNRYFSLRDWLFDLRSISRYVRDQRIEIIHTHLSHDHGSAVASLLLGRNKTLLVRTDHKRDGLGEGRGMGWLLKQTDGLVAYSERIRQHDIKTFSFPEGRTAVVSPAVHLYEGPLKDVRRELGLGEGEKVVGVIGRLKKDRGYDVILKAFRKVRDRMDGVKLVIVGRSSQLEESIKRPVAELGLEHDVVLAGYRTDDYFSVISAFDLFVMMRAGSDGTARALREVMALGRPALVSTRGMLPELVEDGQTGFVVDPDETQLAERMESLLRDESLRRLFGANARKVAQSRWNYEAQGKSVVAFYERILRLGKRQA
jgi:glycosyltransferase involved in cell wall biosynthesis